MKQIEVKTIIRKYESFRLKDANREKYLLSSIRECGIKEPLACSLNDAGTYTLLDGYKRLRCLTRLKIALAPVVQVGSGEADSILHLIRLSNERTLNILEQAIFVNELKAQFGLAVSDIALQLERSPAWVSVRIGIFSQMSELIRAEVFAGRFPVRSYMYTLRQFTRVNKIKAEELDQFVKAVAGHGLSLRQIATLADEYFHGGKELKTQIEQGELIWTLRQLKKNAEACHEELSTLTEAENQVICALELFQKARSRLTNELSHCKAQSENFSKIALLFIEGILASLTPFKKELELFYAARKHT